MAGVCCYYENSFRTLYTTQFLSILILGYLFEIKEKQSPKPQRAYLVFHPEIDGVLCPWSVGNGHHTVNQTSKYCQYRCPYYILRTVSTIDNLNTSCLSYKYTIIIKLLQTHLPVDTSAPDGRNPIWECME